MATKYKIVIKRDFGPYGYWNSKTRRNERKGFVVTDGICNVMPGATWFRTVEEAMRAIQILVEVDGDADAFWQKIRA